MHPGFRDKSAGVVELLDDADARSFARGVVRGLMRADPAAYRSWILHVCEETRPVVSIRFDELGVQKEAWVCIENRKRAARSRSLYDND
jgi:hypothetical protein